MYILPHFSDKRQYYITGCLYTHTTPASSPFSGTPTSCDLFFFFSFFLFRIKKGDSSRLKGKGEASIKISGGISSFFHDYDSGSEYDIGLDLSNNIHILFILSFHLVYGFLQKDYIQNGERF